MTKAVWDDVGKKKFETGVDHGMLYLLSVAGLYDKGYAWNGLTGITETPSGAEATALYADNIKYVNILSAEELGLTIEAYTFPDEFAECDGSAELVDGAMLGQQARKVFGLSYRTKIGNDVAGNDLGYKLHLIYGCLASPSERAYASVNDSPEGINFSWEVKTTPVPATGFKPTALIVIDSTKADAAKLAALETILYGDVAVEPRLPLPDEIKTLLTP